MSSPNNHGQSSPMIRHRSLGKLPPFGSLQTDSTWNGVLTSGKRSAAQAVQLANQLQQLTVTDDATIVSTATGGPSSTRISSRLPNESLVEEDFHERLKKLINEFMTRLDRRHEYNTTMRWTVDDGNGMNYSVVILINQPSELI